MDEARFQRAVEAFDHINAEDPNQLVVGGDARPRELVDAERLAAWVTRLDPNASETLRLAARCQHLRRWHIPRDSFPKGRSGYLKWRAELARFHADSAAQILKAMGYDELFIDAVRRIILKRGLGTGSPETADVQTMEDALCLAFIEHELDEFSSKHDDVTLERILRKTWSKMSERARTIALELPLSERLRALVSKALGGARRAT